MDWFRFPRGADRLPGGVAAPDQPRELVLFKFDGCGYCQRVIRAIDRLGIEVTYRDTLTEPDSLDALVEATGLTQVPCLFVDGAPLFESADIVRWLEAYAVAVRPPR